MTNSMRMKIAGVTAVLAGTLFGQPSPSSAADAPTTKPAATRPAKAAGAIPNWPGPKPRPADAKLPPAAASDTYWTYQDFAEGKIAQTFTIAKEHPRLLITPKNKAEMVERAKAVPMIWKKIIADAKDTTEASLIACAAIYQLGLVEGFKYDLTREEYGQKGVELLLGALKEDKKSHHENVSYMVIPCAYDWLFDLLTADQRKTMAERLTQLAAAEKDKPCTIHGPKMIFGLAFYGDGADDAAAKSIVENEFKEWWDPKAKSKNLVSLLIYSEDSGSPDGYISCRTGLAPVLAAWKTATDQDYFANLGMFRGYPAYVVSRFLPNSPWSQLPLNNYRAGGMADCQELALMGTGYLSDPDPRGAALCRWWLDQGRGFETLCVRGVGGGSVFLGVVIGDGRVHAFSPSEVGLATTSAFDGGTNAVFAQSAWDDQDATLLGMTSSRYPSNRCQKSTNSFSLYKNGVMLFPYRGQLAHHFYTDGRDIETAPMMFKGDKRVQAQLGGSDAPDGDRSLGKEANGPMSVASEAGQFDYFRSDNNAYPGVSQCQRTVVYLRPTAADKVDHVVILDRFKIEDKEITPHVVYQSVLEPAVGKDFTASEQGAAVRDGQWRFENAPCITVTNQSERGGHGRAFMKLLTPDKVSILKIGGPEHFADNVDGTPAGNNYANFGQKLAPAAQIAEGGYWRFHIVPQSAKEYSVLAAIEATDATQAKPVGTMELVPSDTLLAGRVGPNLVLFAKADKGVEAGSVQIKTAGLLRVVIADLKPATEYIVTLGGKPLAAAKSSSAGTLLVKKPAGDWAGEGLLEVRSTK